MSTVMYDLIYNLSCLDYFNHKQIKSKIIKLVQITELLVKWKKIKECKSRKEIPDYLWKQILHVTGGHGVTSELYFYKICREVLKLK